MANIVKRENASLSKATVVGGLEVKSMDDLRGLSEVLSQSGYFKDASDASKCAVKVLAGMEMGFGAFASMTGIHIIQGRPEVGAGLLASAIKRHPSYNYRVLEHNHEKCAIAFYEKWEGKLEQVGVSEFTLADAQAAGTQNLKKFPRNMLFARALTNGVKWYCPDVTSVDMDSEGENSPYEPMPNPIAFQETDIWMDWCRQMRQCSDRASLASLQRAANEYVNSGALSPASVVGEAIAVEMEKAMERLLAKGQVAAIAQQKEDLTVAKLIKGLCDRCKAEEIPFDEISERIKIPLQAAKLYTLEQYKELNKAVDEYELDRQQASEYEDELTMKAALA